MISGLIVLLSPVVLKFVIFCVGGDGGRPVSSAVVHEELLDFFTMKEE